jgi:aryl-alcohol dehydrogenase-like predicted oxidoreductase
VVEQLQQFARQCNGTLPQRAVARVLAHLAVNCAIVGALNPTEIADTAAGDVPHLTSDDLQTIDRIMRAAVPVGGPSPESTFTPDVEPLFPPNQPASAEPALHM